MALENVRIALHASEYTPSRLTLSGEDHDRADLESAGTFVAVHGEHWRFRGGVALLVGITMTIVACGDDGPGGVPRAEPESGRAAVGESTSTAAMPSMPSTASTEVAAVTTTNESTTTDSPAAATVETTGVVVPVIALDNIFRPERIVVSVGDEVLWENRGQNEHNALSVDGDDWGVDIEDFGPGATYSHVFTEPGQYAYYCSIHGTTTFGMIGTVVVER